MHVTADTITTIGPISPASTAACPITIPPTIPSVEPIGDGSLTPASRNSSKAISITIISVAVDNGTSILLPAILSTSSTGSKFGL
ncbi:hypothetical protein SDC9_168578 [bioreactor metagenome]|uniref:Uncharacterized protein n=1 Tax=bioreactor metagenome TaxID=1076179 RepID=A0A645G5W4_9ZZZZ